VGKWKMVKLGEVFSLIRNGINIKQGIANGGYPITRIETISNGEIDRDKMGYAGITNLSKYSSYILKTGDILMSHINSVKHLGKTALYERQRDEIIIHGMNLLCLRPIETSIYYKYVHHYFRSNFFKVQLSSITKKSVNQASFTVTDLRKLMVPLPPLETQKQIAKTLDTTAELLAMRKQQLAELDNLIKSTFYDMFGDPVSNEKGWERKLLIDITIKIGSGATPRGGRECYKHKGISLIRSMNVHNGVFRYEQLAYLDERQAKQLDNVTVEENDVLINITGASVARSCIVPLDVLPARVNQHVSIIRLKKEKAIPEYINNVLTSITFQTYLLSISGAGGATREAITKRQLQNLVVPLPPLDLQNKFAEIVTKIEEQKALVQKAIDETQYLFDSLMSEYFD